MQKKIIIWVTCMVIVLSIAFIWFSNIVFYLVAAFIFSMLGRPIVKILTKKLKFPSFLASLSAIIVVSGIIVGILSIVLPLIISQIQHLTEIDYTNITTETYVSLRQLHEWLAENNIVISSEQINEHIKNWAKEILSKINLSAILTNLINGISSSGMAVFSVFFISFFFLKDEKLIKKILFLFIPTNYIEKTENILKSSENLLTRYFVGVSIEVLCMMCLLSLGLWALGVENALLYGCLGGFLNIIPYLGPVIGAVLASTLTIINGIDAGSATEIMWSVGKVLSVFIGANLIDNMILQVVIYSNSVKAHPLEIFFVILVAGHVGGIVGMVVAIPLYTVLRIIAKELFKNKRFVSQLTKNM